MLRFILPLFFVPTIALAQDLRQSLIGSWSGEGSVKIRPTSNMKPAKCTAKFKEISGYWLGGSLSCKRGRRRDLVNLRFENPNGNGQMNVDLFDDDGDILVSFDGQLTSEQLALFHPEVLEFGGIEYRPVLVFQTDGTRTFQLSQLGVPTTTDAARYTMTDIVFERQK